jgi:hypothetical protein
LTGPEKGERMPRKRYTSEQIIVHLREAEVELANSEQNLVKAKSAAQTTRSAFNTVLARGTNEPVELEDILTYVPEKGSYEDYVKALRSKAKIKVNKIESGGNVVNKVVAIINDEYEVVIGEAKNLMERSRKDFEKAFQELNNW